MTSLERSPASQSDSVREVRDYYDAESAAYLKCVGPVFQAGLFVVDGREVTPQAHVQLLAERIGLRPGWRVLDAGCGVCGPALEFARLIPDLLIESVTISPEQTRMARERVEAAGLGERVRVTEADYHTLPFAQGTFDLVMFLESAGHSPDPLHLMTEAARVLKPGAGLYIKDTFKHLPAAPSMLALEEIAEFNRIYAYQLRTQAELLATVQAAGFVETSLHDISKEVGTKRFTAAMVERCWGMLVATDFGRRHYRQFFTKSLCWGELRARKRETTVV